jgi:hypothetical protein
MRSCDRSWAEPRGAEALTLSRQSALTAVVVLHAQSGTFGVHRRALHNTALLAAVHVAP